MLPTLKLRFILGEFVLADPMIGLPGAELVRDILPEKSYKCLLLLIIFICYLMNSK